MEPSIRVNILRSLIDSDVDDPDEIGFIEIKQEIDEDSWTGIELVYLAVYFVSTYSCTLT